MGDELEALATRLREAAHYCTDLVELERHCKEVAQGLVTLAAQQDGVREVLSVWFNSLPCDSIGKEHFDRLCQIVGLEQSTRTSP